MRRSLPAALALAAAAVLLALSAPPATADTTPPPTYPTTPVPTNSSPGEPPISAPPNGITPLGHAVGDAATGLSVLRLLPGTVPGNSILGNVPYLPKQSVAEVGFGLSDAQANSESFLNYERSIAQSCPAGVAIAGDSPQTPGCLSQTALADNPQPVSGGLNPPSTALDPLVKVGTLDGQVHARWSPTVGPCVGTISDASTSIANFSALNALPTLPSTQNANTLAGAMTASNLPADQKQALANRLSQMAGPLSSLAGLLATPANASQPGAGSLVSLPNTLASRSVVQLVNIPGSATKAVQAISTMRAASIQLLAGTAMEISLNVVSQPTLTVTSTGEPSTSSVNYTAPVIQIVQGGKVLFTLDAAHPTQDIPIGIPLANVPNAANLPVIGSLLPNGQPLVTSTIPVVDIGVLRLSIAQLNQSEQSWTAGRNGAPFTGYQLGASARLLDLQVLPTAALGMPGLPAALAELSFGEQLARAYAPTGGVQCGSAQMAGTAAAPNPAAPAALAYTTAAYQTVPLFWTATGLILVGAIMVSALPRPRPRPKPSPTPRPAPDNEPAT